MNINVEEVAATAVRVRVQSNPRPSTQYPMFPDLVDDRIHQRCFLNDARVPGIQTPFVRIPQSIVQAERISRLPANILGEIKPRSLQCLGIPGSLIQNRWIVSGSVDGQRAGSIKSAPERTP